MSFNLTTYRKLVFTFFTLAIAASIYFITTLRFSFDFEQFFPQGDEDLIFFQQFSKEFETDDNFMLVGVKNTEGVFKKDFLQKFDSLTEKSLNLPYILDNQSLTKIQLPVKTLFGIAGIPVIHIEDTTYYAEDKARL